MGGLSRIGLVMSVVSGIGIGGGYMGGLNRTGLVISVVSGIGGWKDGGGEGLGAKGGGAATAVGGGGKLSLIIRSPVCGLLGGDAGGLGLGAKGGGENMDGSGGEGSLIVIAGDGARGGDDGARGGGDGVRGGGDGARGGGDGVKGGGDGARGDGDGARGGGDNTGARGGGRAGGGGFGDGGRGGGGLGGRGGGGLGGRGDGGLGGRGGGGLGGRGGDGEGGLGGEGGACTRTGTRHTHTHTHTRSSCCALILHSLCVLIVVNVRYTHIKVESKRGFVSSDVLRARRVPKHSYDLLTPSPCAAAHVMCAKAPAVHLVYTNYGRWKCSAYAACAFPYLDKGTQGRSCVQASEGVPDECVNAPLIFQIGHWYKVGSHHYLYNIIVVVSRQVNVCGFE